MFDRFDELLPILIFVLIPLVQWLRQLFSKNQEEQAQVEPLPRPRPRPERPPAAALEPRPVRMPPSVTPVATQPREVPRPQSRPRPQPRPRTPARAEPRPAASEPVALPPPPGPALQRRPAAPAPARRRTDYARALHNPITLRRAIALATVLGPCRAAAPYGEEQSV